MTVSLNTITNHLLLYSIDIFDALIFTDFYIQGHIHIPLNVTILTEKRRRLIYS